MSSDPQEATQARVGSVPALAPALPRLSRAMGGPETLKHLRRDPVLKRIIRQVGPCTLRPVKREPYEALVRAITHQQVQGRAAEAILGRFIALYPGHDFPPAAQVLETPVEAMRGCGLSGSKVAAIRDIAEKSVGGLVPTRKAAARLSDEVLIERLVAIRGVGRWTVEMLLIFTLGRPDVLPVDDFGVREGWRVATGAETQVKPKELAVIGEGWGPWRSIAAWYLWRAADAAKASRFKPQ
jgi:DNA-3-methyladenine glycosylase II